MDAEKYACPCCGTPNQLDGEGTHDTCGICGWEDDWYHRENPDEEWANGTLTLNQAKRMWAKGETIKACFPHP
ncbi:MAG: CPCC family cysteine-rich protein [Oscillospiraceae bacterium]|nr:CPCC family cysteine-rich protein [Oscillospiraceae bacterium]